MEGSGLGAVCIRRIVECSFWRDVGWVLLVYIVLLKVVMKRLALCAVCIHLIFKVDLERPTFGAVCIHHIVKGRFW
jgi:hypothetical protein